MAGSGSNRSSMAPVPVAIPDEPVCVLSSMTETMFQVRSAGSNTSPERMNMPASVPGKVSWENVWPTRNSEFEGSNTPKVNRELQSSDGDALAASDEFIVEVENVADRHARRSRCEGQLRR